MVEQFSLFPSPAITDPRPPAPRFFLSVNDQAKAVLIPCPANDNRSLRHPAFVVECRGVVDLGRDPGFKVPCEGKGCFFEEGVGCSFVIVNHFPHHHFG